MKLFNNQSIVCMFLICIGTTSCKLMKDKSNTFNKRFTPVATKNTKQIPSTFSDSNDSSNSANIHWKDFFQDENLISLIDTALATNLELLKTMQDIEISRNNVKYKHSFLLPNVTANAGLGAEKVGRYTSQGAGDASTDITPGKAVPDILSDFSFGLHASWEIDVWQKFRNGKKAAIATYLGTIEGKNFVITNLISEIANSYYELLSMDSQLEVIRETIKLQKNALGIVKVQKEAGRANELGVKKFEAEVLNSQSLEFDLLQNIQVTENKINFLLGRFPQPIVRSKSTFDGQLPQQVHEGIPSQLLANRPDVKHAELELYASDCDVKVAQAEFYPSFNISSSIGFQAFKPSYLINPESLLFSLIGDLAAPVINRNAIKAEFNKAKASQLQALYEYQNAILNSYVEVSNELSNIKNLEQLYALKNNEVEALTKGIEVSNDLFKSGKADYFEVLMTQRDALSSKLELIEARKRQFNAVVNLYKELGGGWK